MNGGMYGSITFPQHPGGLKQWKKRISSNAGEQFYVKPWENGGFMGFYGMFPLVNIYITTEHWNITIFSG